jgi:hypothetical protein
MQRNTNQHETDAFLPRPAGEEAAYSALTSNMKSVAWRFGCCALSGVALLAIMGYFVFR